MAVLERYQQKDAWPHLFAPTGRTKEMPPRSAFIITKAQVAREMYCSYCHMIWWDGLDERPVGECPARNDKSEYKRLGVDRPT